MSSHRSLIFGTCFRSSSFSRWIGLRAMIPSTGPLVPQTVNRCPMRTCGSQPPMVETWMKPSSSMYCTIRPIWSQCPASITRNGASTFRAAITLPWTSVRISSANEAA